MQQGQKRIEKYQFSMKNLLGQGSYANVYLGRVIQTGQKVAVKVIDKRLFANSYNVKNIQSEIQIMKKVDHPNIVKLYDVYQTTNNMYIITQLCEDGDFYHLLQRKRKIEEEEAKNYLKQIMKGIKYMHINGIIHRDLKPANILMKNNECKISDFGFAKNLEHDNTIMKSIVGTPLYMSPQLLKKLKYTNKSDLWSIGLIYYEMLHGRTPWPAQNQLQLIQGIYSKKPSFHSSISSVSKDFILNCLQIEENKRMSWEEAFEHQLISNYKPEKVLKFKELENKNQRELSPNHSYASNISTQKVNMQREIKNNNKITLKANVFVIKKGKDNKQNEDSNIFMNGNSDQIDLEMKQKARNLTPTISKNNNNISERRLKKVQALTPKGNHKNQSPLNNNSSIAGRLKDVLSFTPRGDSNLRKKGTYKSQINLNVK